MKVQCLGLIFAAACLAQPPSHERSPISGIVIDASGEPLRHAVVQLSPVPAGPGRSSDAPVSSAAAETDSRGNFAFEEVALGRYMLTAERTGYLTARYVNAHGVPVVIETGQPAATGIVIKMFPQGIIAGRVVDDENEPRAGVTVTVQFYSSPGQRQRGNLPANTGTT